MKDRIVKVVENLKVADKTFKMVLKADDLEPIRGGQFIHIQLPDKTKILRRPFCIADFDTVNKTVTIVYAVVGGGTELLTGIKAGTELTALFPLGNGFMLKEFDNKPLKKIVMVGGGLGAAVLPAIPNNFKDVEFYTFLGFGNSDRAVLVDELRAKSKELYIATDDGSLGTKGFVTDLMKSKLDEIKPDVILACGPEVMFKSLKKVAEDVDIPVYVSLEARMGCGIGACLVCNCKIKTTDGDKYKRVCVDGPVFKLDEVVL